MTQTTAPKRAAKKYDYVLTANAPHSILIETEEEVSQFSAMGGTVTETFDGETLVEIPFSHENALKLRHFLKGRRVQIDPRAKATLARLANDPEALDNKEIIWSQRLSDLKDVPHKVGKRGMKGLTNKYDLLHYFPLRYIDKSNPQTVDELTPGVWAVVVGEIVGQPTWDPVRTQVRVVVADAKNQRISATFFRQPWYAHQYREGDGVVLYGNFSVWVNQRGHKVPQITNPKMDKVTTNRGGLDFIPVYPQKNSNKTWEIQLATKALLESIVWLEDPVPQPLLDKHGLMSRDAAYREIHYPTGRANIEEARRRIAFDEFVRLQVFLRARKNEAQAHHSPPKTKTSLADAFTKSLPFTFTEGQETVIQEILADLAQEKPMYRLLQGDVGSGKTEVASHATLTAVGSGYQTVMLAPTDVLASQLFDRLEGTFAKAGLDVTTELFTGRTTGKRREALLDRVKSGETRVLVGTHSVISPEVKFENLGLVVVDEQHKFGVEQRTALLSKGPKGHRPDLLMMSATPIPRTTSQVVYGDMDISIVNTPPSGRKPVITEWHQYPDVAWEKVREQVKEGRQAYVVAALVEENDTIVNVQAATDVYEQLKHEIFPDLRVGLVHGKLKKKEKDEVVKSFTAGEIDILVATTVIEVGVNVPNATVMTVLNSGRYGIASLHQIRGRVGRGSDQAWCYLVSDVTSAEGEERLNALVYTTDGFWLAEKDLELRGEGNLFGQLQSGDSDMAVANLRDHKDLLEVAKKVASQAEKSVMLKREVDILYAGRVISA